MLAVPARRLVTAGTLSLALSLSAPLPALADPADRDGRDGRADREHGQEHRQEHRRDVQGKPKPSAERQASSSRGSSSGQRPSSSPRAAGPQDGESGRTYGDGRERQPGGDPRGNNGTVKIDGEAFDDGRGNEPHVGCVFQVDFYGFDAGQTAALTFTGLAPTGGGLLHSETSTPISDDAAGGGRDRDASLIYSVEDQLAALLAFPRHPQQGWHVKLAVEVDGAPGGAKSKVFWIDCPAAAAPADAAEQVAAADADVAVAAGTAMSGAGTPVATFGGADTSGVLAQSGTAVTGTTVAAAEQQDQLAVGAAAAERVSSRGSRLPAVLAFTGLAGLAGLLTLGTGAVGAGAAAHRLGRRPAADVVS